METKALVFRTWDDLVFANRNKEYGAYSIRRAYSKRIILGWGVSVAIIAVLLLIPGLTSRDTLKPIPIEVDAGVIVLHDYVLPIIPKELPRRTETQVQATNPDAQVRVVREEVDTQPQEQSSSVTSIEGDEGGEGGPVGGTSIQGTDLPIIVEEPGVRNFAEVMPQYEGGIEAMMKFIRKKIHYPASARRLGITGAVYVSFVVNGDGSVRDVSIVRGIHLGCDEEAMRVISMLPGWRGGKQGGRPVPVRMVLPIKFSLEN